MEKQYTRQEILDSRDVHGVRAYLRDMDGRIAPFPAEWLKRNTRRVPPCWSS
jgi:hypothetical protein